MNTKLDQRASVAQTLDFDKVFYEVTLPRRRYKILFVTDLHLRDSEFKNTNGYVVEIERILLRIIDGAKKGLYDVVILLGDVFDTYYKDVAKALYHISLFAELRDILEGRLFKLLGNHSLNKKKNYVPTFFLLGSIKATRINKEELDFQITSNGFIQNFGLQREVFTAPDRLLVNGNIINFFHYNAKDKTYFDPLLGMEYNKHIGCYHDTIMPSNVREKVQKAGSDSNYQLRLANNADLSGVFSNVDYAILGDIHTKVGEFTLTDSNTNKTTIVDIPGSLGRTQYHRAQLHNEVFLPILTIEEDGEVLKQHMRVPLTDYRDIFRIDSIEEQKENREQLSNFKDALEFLRQESSLQIAIDEANVNPRVKEIINSLINDQYPSIAYRTNRD